MRRKTKGFPAVIGSSRDNGKDGYRGCSPWARQGIFIFSGTRIGQSESTPEFRKRPRVENKGLKMPHKFDGGGTFVCLHCMMMREGHDRLMKRLASEVQPERFA